MRKSTSGFTIVELLIVIVVIAILASISLVAYNAVVLRAQTSAMVADLKSTQKALNAYRVSSGADRWWIDTDPTLSGISSGNPTISAIIAAQPNFRAYLKNPPTKNGFNTANNWFYDNDGDTYGGCSASTAGIGIIIYNPQNDALEQSVDEAMDDGNLSCGMVRVAGGNFIIGLE